MRIHFHRRARTAPDVIDGLKVPYGAGKRGAAKWRWYLVLALVMSPAAWLLFSSAGRLLTWSANGSVMLQPYELRAPVGARIATLNVAVGAEVEAGDVMLTLHDPELEAAIAEARARRTSKPAAVRATNRLLLAELELLEQSLQRQQERLTAITELVHEGAATAAERREAQIAVDQAAAAVLRVRQQIAPRSSSPHVSLADDAQRDLERLLAKREQLTIRAPETGRVLDVLATQGEFIGAGATLLLIGRTVEPKVVAYVAPDVAPKLSVGSPATIRFPDGSKATAFVAEQPMLMRRMPADVVDQLGVRPMTVVLHLQTNRSWPANQRIHGLPVTIRFHYGWEPERRELLAGRAAEKN